MAVTAIGRRIATATATAAVAGGGTAAWAAAQPAGGGKIASKHQYKQDHRARLAILCAQALKQSKDKRCLIPLAVIAIGRPIATATLAAPEHQGESASHQQSFPHRRGRALLVILSAQALVQTLDNRCSIVMAVTAIGIAIVTATVAIGVGAIAADQHQEACAS
jgi:hypothetical protein